MKNNDILDFRKIKFFCSLIDTSKRMKGKLQTKGINVKYI